MKKIILFLTLVFVFLACSDTKHDMTRFSNAYREVLIAREKYADSVVANKKVFEVLNKYGYDMKSFWAESQMHFEENREEFITMIDSLRNSIRSDINNLERDTVSLGKKKNLIIKEDNSGDQSK